MPAKKIVKSKKAAKPLAPSMPAWQPAPVSKTAVLTETAPAVILGTLMVVTLSMLAVFGAVFANGMNGIFSLGKVSSKPLIAAAEIIPAPNFSVVGINKTVSLKAVQSVCGPTEVVNYKWTTQNLSLSGPQFVLANSGSANATVTWSDSGDRLVSLTGSCGSGNAVKGFAASYKFKVIPDIGLWTDDLLVNRAPLAGSSDRLPKILSGQNQAISWRVIDQSSKSNLQNLSAQFNVWLVTAPSKAELSSATSSLDILIGSGLLGSQRSFSWPVSQQLNGKWAKVRVCVIDSGICSENAPFMVVSSMPACSSQYKLGDIDQSGVADASDISISSLLNGLANPLAMFPCADANNDKKFDAVDGQTFINCLSGVCRQWPSASAR